MSEKYGLAYFDTGMVYRAVGLELILNSIPLENENEAENVGKAHRNLQSDLSHSTRQLTIGGFLVTIHGHMLQ